MKSIVINGYGTIGIRVVDAVSARDDVKVVGVSKTKPSYEAKMAVEKWFGQYTTMLEEEKPDNEKEIRSRYDCDRQERRQKDCQNCPNVVINNFNFLVTLWHRQMINDNYGMCYLVPS